MASLRAYTWQAFDTIWHIAGRYMQSAGYTDVPTFVRAIQITNNTILDWRNLAVGTVIIIPYATN